MINNVLNLLYKNKALNIKIINNEKLYSNYIIITTGTSDKHIKHLMLSIIKNMKKKVVMVSGKNTNWVIIDMDIITLHIMSKFSRIIYNLELFYNEI